MFSSSSSYGSGEWLTLLATASDARIHSLLSSMLRLRALSRQLQAWREREAVVGLIMLRGE